MYPQFESQDGEKKIWIRELEVVKPYRRQANACLGHRLPAIHTRSTVCTGACSVAASTQKKISLFRIQNIFVLYAMGRVWHLPPWNRSFLINKTAKGPRGGGGAHGAAEGAVGGGEGGEAEVGVPQHGRGPRVDVDVRVQAGEHLGKEGGWPHTGRRCTWYGDTGRQEVPSAYQQDGGKHLWSVTTFSLRPDPSGTPLMGSEKSPPGSGRLCPAPPNGGAWMGENRGGGLYHP